MLSALRLHVNGVVQGVGFRPFVYRLAKRNLVNGWVLNAADGVDIHVEGEEPLVDQFVMELSEEAPAAAQVKRIDISEVPLEGFQGFEIRFSDDSAVAETTLVSPDLATCDDCLAELFDPQNRRYRYPFINCTNCGPRFTIIESLPYDRAHTSMKDFTMCPACQYEYDDPEDRRFHAQPDACFECGPHISWHEGARGEGGHSGAAGNGVGGTVGTGNGGASGNDGSELGIGDSDGGIRAAGNGEGGIRAAENNGSDTRPAKHVVEWGKTRQESDAILARAVGLLRDGGILAVKGLGGFHLACDATNEQTLARLRTRKRREGKAFAIMAADVEQARAWAQLSVEEAALLESPARPIVLLKKRQDVRYPAGLADKLPEIGIMLPATPLQHLLLHDFGRVLVMTSGNLHDEPIQTDDATAYQALADVADAFLGNNRPILARYDDSVVRLIRTGCANAAGKDAEREAISVQLIRRARGLAPQPIELKNESGCTVFATGPEQKNTFTLLRGSNAFVSQHLGDMENVETYDAWLEAKRTYERLFEAKPERLVCDFHPEYLTSKWAHAQGSPLDQVQHHHAHVAAVMGENNIDEAVCGIAFDGTGYGPDGAIWGGEALLANRATYERFANIVYAPMPGGAAAIKHPLRMAYGVLWVYDLLDHPGARDAIEALGDLAPLCEQMIERGLNTPYTSSVGRLFDAASALLGICAEPTYEGEGAVLLEAALAPVSGPDAPAASREADALVPIEPATPDTPAVQLERATPDTSDAYHFSIVKNSATKESTALDTSVLLLDAAPVFKALLDDKMVGVPTAEIARRFHEAFVEAIAQVAQLVHMMYDIRIVTLSGGVFMNRYLIEHAVRRLSDAGFTVAINRELPPNDASVSFGETVVALARGTRMP